MKKLFLIAGIALSTIPAFSQNIFMKSQQLVWKNVDTVYTPEINVWYLNFESNTALYTVFDIDDPVMIKKFEIKSVTFYNDKNLIHFETVDKCQVSMVLDSNQCILKFDDMSWIGVCEKDMINSAKKDKKSR